MFGRKKNRHDHQWRIDSASIRRTIAGSSTHLIIQCEGCAEPREVKIADFEMTGDQVNNYCLARYDQATNFGAIDPNTVRPIYL